MRPRGDHAIDASMLAIFADHVPSGIGAALGKDAGGNSLDNTIRIVRLAPTDWVLCDINIHAVHGGFGHGAMRLFTREGLLLATASQSCIVRMHDQDRRRGGERGIDHFDAPARFFTRSSTTAGSARVVVSPRLPMSPSATLRRMRRMILPERVLGRPGAHWITSGRGEGADLAAHPVDQLGCAGRRVGSTSAFSVT